MRVDRAASPTSDDDTASQFSRHLESAHARHGLHRSRAADARSSDTRSTDRRPDVVTVTRGDTLSEIAERHGSSMKSVYRANRQFDRQREDGIPHFDRSARGGWDPDYLRPGDRIRLLAPRQPHPAPHVHGRHGARPAGPQTGRPPSGSIPLPPARPDIPPAGTPPKGPPPDAPSGPATPPPQDAVPAAPAGPPAAPPQGAPPAAPAAPGAPSPPHDATGQHPSHQPQAPLTPPLVGPSLSFRMGAGVELAGKGTRDGEQVSAEPYVKGTVYGEHLGVKLKLKGTPEAKWAFKAPEAADPALDQPEGPAVPADAAGPPAAGPASPRTGAAAPAQATTEDVTSEVAKTKEGTTEQAKAGQPGTGAAEPAAPPAAAPAQATAEDVTSEVAKTGQAKTEAPAGPAAQQASTAAAAAAPARSTRGEATTGEASVKTGAAQTGEVKTGEVNTGEVKTDTPAAAAAGRLATARSLLTGRWEKFTADIGMIGFKRSEIGVSLEWNPSKGWKGFQRLYYAAAKDPDKPLADTGTLKLGKVDWPGVVRAAYQGTKASLAQSAQEAEEAGGRFAPLRQATWKAFSKGEMTLSGEFYASGSEATGFLNLAGKATLERIGSEMEHPPAAAPGVRLTGMAAGVGGAIFGSWITDKMIGSNIENEYGRAAVDRFGGAMSGLVLDPMGQRLAAPVVAKVTAPVADALAPVVSRMAQPALKVAAPLAGAVTKTAASLTSAAAPVVERAAPVLARAGEIASKVPGSALVGRVARNAARIGPIGTALVIVPDAVDAVTSFRDGDTKEGWKAVARGTVRAGLTAIGAGLGQTVLVVPGVGAAAGAVAGGLLADWICKHI